MGLTIRAGKTEKLAHIGQDLVLVALFLQIVIFSLFVAVAVVFQRRLAAQPTQQSQGVLRWKRNIRGLYSASALILLRNLVRVVEYIQGYGGYVNGHEWFLYVFDAVPMFAVMVVLAVIYAPSLLKECRMDELPPTTVELQQDRTKA